MSRARKVRSTPAEAVSARVSSNVLHKVHVWSERPFSAESLRREFEMEQELAERDGETVDVEQFKRNQDAAEVFTALLELEELKQETAIHFKLSRGLRSQGRVPAVEFVENANFTGNRASWTQFVQMINEADKRLADLERRLGVERSAQE